MSISAAALDGSCEATHTTPAEESEKNFTLGLNSRLLFLIPAITGIAVGILFIPNFTLGLAVGAFEVPIKLISLVVLSATGIISSDKSESKYSKQLESSLFYVSVIGPIAEEGIFRGVVQPLLTRAIQIIVPAAAAIAFGPFSIATTISIVASGIFFGAVHYFNNHDGAHIQAVFASVTGVVYGTLAAQFGIGASIAAHIINNTVVSTLTTLPNKNSDRSIEFAIPT